MTPAAFLGAKEEGGSLHPTTCHPVWKRATRFRMLLECLGAVLDIAQSFGSDSWSISAL